jgi:site-specific DNA-methyltransferase (adenine-specific)
VRQIVKEVIGDCTLYYGDSREVLPLLDSIDSVVTDPPYGMAFQSNYRNEKHIKIENDCTTDLLEWACEIEALHSKYIFCRWDNLVDVPKPKSAITWVKNNWSMGDLQHEHARQTELCLFYNGADHFFPSGRPQDVIKAARTENALHPTEKPVGLMEAVVRWTSGTVFDPFMGSGSTGVACAKMGRKFVGVEIEKKYFDIACERIREAYKQPDMFVSQPKSEEPSQEAFF